jgi:transglutaminase-like putative cysteine protease
MRTRRSNLVLFAALVLTTSLSAARCAASAFDPWTDTVRYTFEYRVDFSALDVAETERLGVWLPYPAETPVQTVLSAAVDAPWPHTVHTDGNGNRVVHLEERGVPERPVVMRFVVERRPSHGIPAAKAEAGTALDPARHRRADKLIPLGGVIRALAEEKGAGKTTDAEKVRAYYDYVVRTMRYNKDGTGWGRGDAIWACDNKRGNCTDFHSLLIGMARSQGIPARFVIGFPVPADRDAGEIGGYHCWADYWDREHGWVPLDASEATKSWKHEAYFGTLPSDRIEFTVGRDLVLTPPQAGEPLNFFIYPYAEVDGKPVPADRIRAAFRFERTPVARAGG